MYKWLIKNWTNQQASSIILKKKKDSSRPHIISFVVKKHVKLNINLTSLPLFTGFQKDLIRWYFLCLIWAQTGNIYGELKKKLNKKSCFMKGEKWFYHKENFLRMYS